MGGTRRETIIRGTDKQFYPRLLSRNGEILAVGEGHETRQGAERNLQAMVKAALRLAPEMIETGD